MTDSRITEQRNPRTGDIDLASPLEIVRMINREDQLVAQAVATQEQAIGEAIELAEAAFRASGRLIYVGAGTSGRLGVLDASECPPTFGVDPDMVQGIIAGGSPALTRSQEGAEDNLEAARLAMDERSIGPNDFVVGIAASGTTPFVAVALQRARERGARVAIVACTAIAPELRAIVDVAIIPVVGPEVVTGSTRMKAGTATKLVLNMISTGAMIRIGKTYGNLMVDLQMTNAKLIDRAERIIVDVCGISRSEARALLTASGKNVKTAIVMHHFGVDKDEAERHLGDAGGVIRKVFADE